MNYNYIRELHERKIKYIIIILLIIAIIIGGIFYFYNKDNIYDQFNQYNEDNKSIGEVKHYKDESENLYVSMYYPETKNKELNKIVNEFYKNYLKGQKENKKSKDIIYMDYSINEVFNQYINLKLKINRYDEDVNVISTTNKLLTYDLKNEKVLTVEDCLRNNYKSILSSNINGIEDIDSSSSNIVVENKKLLIYSDEKLKNKVEINYEENKDLIKLANKNIPSNAPLDVAKPADQPQIDPNKKMIAITLDDGPHKTNTLKVIELFEKYNGRATFFMLGKNAELYFLLVGTRASVNEHGFEIGSHSWDHPDLKKLDLNGINDQIVNTQNAIFKITGYEPKFIRPPFGSINDTVKTAISNNGMKIALWNLDTEDWKLKDANKIKDVIVNKAFDGAVILIHDIHSFTVNGLELALEELNNRGYQFVTLDTLEQYFELKSVIK